MALQFRPYDDQAGQETRSRWANSLDGIFNQYMASKAQARAQGLQDRQLADADGAQLASQGFLNRHVTPDVMAAASLSDPMAARNTGMAPKELEVAMALRAFREKRDADAGLARRKTASEAEENEAQAWALRNPQGKGQTPPPGYRFTAGGNRLEAIPGGPADQKIEGDKQRMENAADSVTTKAKRVIGVIDNIIPRLGLGTAGFGAPTLSNVGGTDAAEVKADLDTVIANLSFDELQRMRDESKTGGALGAVAVRELDLLGSRVGNLSQAQGPAQLRRNLSEVKESYLNVIKAMEKMRAQKGIGNPAPSDGNKGDKSSIASLLDKYGAP